MTKDLQKVKDLLKVMGCSDRTIDNYLSCLNRFKKSYEGKDLKKLRESDILDYLKTNFIDLGLLFLFKSSLRFVYLFF